MVSHTSDSTFARDVLEAEGMVLVDFWAPWCGPCRMVGPILDQVSELVDGQAKVVKLNVDENPQVAGRYGITGIPTVMVFKGGQVVNQLVGAQPAQMYLTAVKAA